LYATLARYAREHAGDHLTIVETGTARGFSALCMAKALDDGGAAGRIVSFDVLPHDVAMLWNCLRDAEGPRTRAELLHEYAGLIERHVMFHRGDTRRELARLSVPRVHFAFLDSVHEYDHVMAEFSSIRGRQRPGDVLFFDDYTIESYPGVVKAADEICRDHRYSATVVAANARRRYLIAEKQ
jgi:predicted O-methyltransferase YrrM